jgi:hypothetical protein
VELAHEAEKSPANGHGEQELKMKLKFIFNIVSLNRLPAEVNKNPKWRHPEQAPKISVSFRLHRAWRAKDVGLMAATDEAATIETDGDF